MSEAVLAALPVETAFNICSEFIKSGGEDGKGTGIPNGFGQAQEERKTLYKWFKQASEGDIKGERPTLMKARDLLHRGATHTPFGAPLSLPVGARQVASDGCSFRMPPRLLLLRPTPQAKHAQEPALMRVRSRKSARPRRP